MERFTHIQAQTITSTLDKRTPSEREFLTSEDLER